MFFPVFWTDPHRHDHLGCGRRVADRCLAPAPRASSACLFEPAASARSAQSVKSGHPMYEALVSGGSVRRLWIGEAELYRQHLLRLDAESRRNRFGGAVSDEFIRRYAESSALSGAVIYGFFVDDVLRGAAELRLLEHAGDAEAALSVEKPWQSCGVGTALFERVLLAARNRQIERLHMLCLAENRRVQQLARKFGAELSFEPGSVTSEVQTPRPTRRCRSCTSSWPTAPTLQPRCSTSRLSSQSGLTI
jgi:GNAT superfamily N-acetyltransferase